MRVSPVLTVCVGDIDWEGELELVIDCEGDRLRDGLRVLEDVQACDAVVACDDDADRL